MAPQMPALRMLHQPTHIIELTDAAGSNNRQTRLLGERHGGLEIDALHHAVAVNVGVHHSGDPGIGEASCQIGGLEFALAGPPLYRNATVARINADNDVPGN